MNEDLQRKKLKVRQLANELAEVSKYATKSDIQIIDDKLRELKKWVRILSDELSKS